MTTRYQVGLRVRRSVIVVALALCAAGFPLVAAAAPYPPVPPIPAVSSGVVVPGASSPATVGSPPTGVPTIAPGDWPVQAPTGAGPVADEHETAMWSLIVGMVLLIAAATQWVRIVRRS